MHLLDLNGKLPKIPVPSDELLPPIGLKSPIKNDNVINSRALLPIEPTTLPNFIDTTTFPIADNKDYNLPNATPVSLFSRTNAEPTVTPVTVRPIERQSVSNFNNLFHTITPATTPTIESTTSSIPRIFFTTNSLEPQNSTKIPQQKLSSTDSLQETTSLRPESWRRLLILGEQKTPGYAVRSDGSIDSDIAFPYTTAVPIPSFGFKKRPVTTATSILLPVLETASFPQTTFADLNDNPFLPPSPVQSQFDAQNGSFNKNSNELSTLRVNNLFSNQSNSFAAFKFTVSGFQKITTPTPIIRNEPTHASFFAQTTNARSIFTVIKTSTKTSNPVWKENQNISTLNEFTTSYASNESVAQPPKVRNGFELPKNIQAPDNNPLLPPLAPVMAIAISNFTLKNQGNIRNGISINENPINPNNPENSQAKSLSTVNHLASTTEKSKIDSFPSTSNPFAAFKLVSGFYKNSKSSPIVRNQPPHAQTTNSDSIFTTTEITTATSDSAQTVKPNTFSLNRFTTYFASNISVPQPPEGRNGVEISKNIPVPDNNPFLAPLASINGIAMPNFAFNNQVNNRENIQTTISSSVNHLASTTEKSIIDSYPSKYKSFTSFYFPSSNDSNTSQSIENPTTALIDRIGNSNEITTTETSNPIEKATIQPTNQTHLTFFEPVTDSITVKTPPNFPNNDLLPPLSSESSINAVENNNETSPLEIFNNPFLPTLDLNPFLAPFSSHLAQTVPQQISSIPSLDVSTTTKSNIQSTFPSKFDNSALRKSIFVKPITQVNYFKYTGGFGAPPGILSPHDKQLQ